MDDSSEGAVTEQRARLDAHIGGPGGHDLAARHGVTGKRRMRW